MYLSRHRPTAILHFGTSVQKVNTEAILDRLLTWSVDDADFPLSIIESANAQQIVKY